MSVHMGSALASASRPARYTSIGELGLNPSLRFHSVMSMVMPSALESTSGRATRLPVAVALSATVNQSLG